MKVNVICGILTVVITNFTLSSCWRLSRLAGPTANPTEVTVPAAPKYSARNPVVAPFLLNSRSRVIPGNGNLNPTSGRGPLNRPGQRLNEALLRNRLARTMAQLNAVHRLKNLTRSRGRLGPVTGSPFILNDRRRRAAIQGSPRPQAKPVIHANAFKPPVAAALKQSNTLTQRNTGGDVQSNTSQAQMIENVVMKALNKYWSDPKNCPCGHQNPSASQASPSQAKQPFVPAIRFLSFFLPPRLPLSSQIGSTPLSSPQSTLKSLDSTPLASQPTLPSLGSTLPSSQPALPSLESAPLSSQIPPPPPLPSFSVKKPFSGSITHVQPVGTTSVASHGNIGVAPQQNPTSQPQSAQGVAQPQNRNPASFPCLNYPRALSTPSRQFAKPLSGKLIEKHPATAVQSGNTQAKAPCETIVAKPPCAGTQVERTQPASIVEEVANPIIPKQQKSAIGTSLDDDDLGDVDFNWI